MRDGNDRQTSAEAVGLSSILVVVDEAVAELGEITQAQAVVTTRPVDAAASLRNPRLVGSKHCCCLGIIVVAAAVANDDDDDDNGETATVGRIRSVLSMSLVLIPSSCSPPTL